MTTQIATRIAGIISDYRQLGLDVAHVQRWANQFDEAVRPTVLSETAHVLDTVYVSQANALTFARALARNPKLVGNDPKAFWLRTHLIRAGINNRSQNDLIKLTEDALKAEGLAAAPSLGAATQFLYVDDGIFTGNQLLRLLKDWIVANDMKACTIYVLVLGLHTGGWWYANKHLSAIARPRNISIEWKCVVEIKSGVNDPAQSQVLWPTALPSTPEATAWVAANLGPKDFIPRPPNGPSSTSFFSSETARQMLEREFFHHGCKLIGLAKSPSAVMRPLGFTKLRTPGLGTMFATYRNCPNNAPLVMWWGDPSEGYPLNQWYPLLPRSM